MDSIWVLVVEILEVVLLAVLDLNLAGLGVVVLIIRGKPPSPESESTSTPGSVSTAGSSGTGAALVSIDTSAPKDSSALLAAGRASVVGSSVPTVTALALSAPHTAAATAIA